MSVRAKFKIRSVEPANGEGVFNIRGEPVIPRDDQVDHENRAFWKLTPAGTLHLGTVNAAAAEYFKPGEEYYLDITRASEVMSPATSDPMSH